VLKRKNRSKAEVWVVTSFGVTHKSTNLSPLPNRKGLLQGISKEENQEGRKGGRSDL
jgi:hypothetical protein